MERNEAMRFSSKDDVPLTTLNPGVMSPEQKAQAACRDRADWLDPPPPGGGTNGFYKLRKQVCARCPVRDVCAIECDYVETTFGDGVQRNNIHGVWGAETPNERIQRRKGALRAVA